MTTLTVQVDDALMERTMKIASSKQASLDDFVADALKVATEQNSPSCAAPLSIKEAMARLGHVHFDPPYSREEMNER